MFSRQQQFIPLRLGQISCPSSEFYGSWTSTPEVSTFCGWTMKDSSLQKEARKWRTTKKIWKKCNDGTDLRYTGTQHSFLIFNKCLIFSSLRKGNAWVDESYDTWRKSRNSRQFERSGVLDCRRKEHRYTDYFLIFWVNVEFSRVSEKFVNGSK